MGVNLCPGCHNSIYYVIDILECSILVLKDIVSNPQITIKITDQAAKKSF